jgi:4-hydroxy-tetrahydrodipicolinate reductase
MINVAVTGAAGRMGRTLIQVLTEGDGMRLGAALERPGHDRVGADAGELAGLGHLGVPVSDDLTAVVDEFDTLIDFSVPESTLAALHVCCAASRRMVIGTTGFDTDGLAAIEAAASEIPIVMAPNMSVGVNVAFKLIEMAAAILGDDVDVEVIEAHHRDKVDAPSGTAVRIGEILAETLGRDLETDAVYDRHGINGPRDRRTIGFQSIRGGDLVGEHTVMFAGTGERIEITHRASSRSNFAFGAVRAVRWLQEKPPGLYDIQQVLGLG